MPDYQNMYLLMARASENAMRILIEAQQEAEETYINSPEAGIKPLPSPEE